jgi:hypothetical protein
MDPAARLCSAWIANARGICDIRFRIPWHRARKARLNDRRNLSRDCRPPRRGGVQENLVKTTAAPPASGANLPPESQAEQVSTDLPSEQLSYAKRTASCEKKARGSVRMSAAAFEAATCAYPSSWALRRWRAAIERAERRIACICRAAVGVARLPRAGRAPRRVGRRVAARRDAQAADSGGGDGDPAPPPAGAGGARRWS